MPSVHELSDVKSNKIGTGTRVWQYSIVFENAVIGVNCNICAHTLIESDVVVGDNVTIKSGVFLWDGTRIGNNVFIGPNATFTNDNMPRSKIYPESYLGITVKDGASIGANATLLPGVIIGAHSMVGAGSVVVCDVPDNAVVVGNPAKVIRYLSND